MKARGHDARFLLRDLSAGSDLDGAGEIPRERRAHLVRAAHCEGPLSFGEILLNSAYHDPPQHKALIDAWRERLKGSHAVSPTSRPPRTSRR